MALRLLMAQSMKLPMVGFGYLLLVPFLLVSSVAFAGTDARYIGPVSTPQPPKQPKISARAMHAASKVVQHGEHYKDARSGANVHVKGKRVVITDAAGVLLSRFKNSRHETLQRIAREHWVRDDRGLHKPYSEMNRTERRALALRQSEARRDGRLERAFKGDGIDVAAMVEKASEKIAKPAADEKAPAGKK